MVAETLSGTQEVGLGQGVEQLAPGLWSRDLQGGSSGVGSGR